MSSPRTASVYISSTGKTITIEVCCSDFATATQSGTDGEGYGPLIGEFQYQWTIGSMGALDFCPWCGAKAVPVPKTETPNEEDSK